MKTIIIGDIGGQYRVLTDTLERIGIKEDLIVPEGIIVIQVGDIIRMANHNNLNSLACAELIDKLLRRNPTQWIQLLGNHESPMMNGPYPNFWMNMNAFHQCHDIINTWWKEGLVKLAVGFELNDGYHVLTHAGITRGYLEDMNLLESEAPEVISHINSVVGTIYEDVAQYGVVTFSEYPNPNSDFLWASTMGELIPSWEECDEDMKFHQIHGHDTALLSWEEPTTRFPLPGGWKAEIDADQRLMTVVSPHGVKLRTTDWVLKETVDPDSREWGLLEINAAPFH